MRKATKRLKKNREAAKTAANISTGTTTSHFPSPRAIHTSNGARNRSDESDGRCGGRDGPDFQSHGLCFDVALHQARDILAYDIELEVDRRSDLQRMEIGMLVGIGNDGDPESSLARIDYRQADAVDGYRAFSRPLRYPAKDRTRKRSTSSPSASSIAVQRAV